MVTDKKYPNVPGSRRGAPETSREAGESVASIALSIRARVLLAILDAGAKGRTGDAVALAVGLTPVQVRARIAELHAGKVIADSGRRDILDSGRRGVVWIGAQDAPQPDDLQLSLLAAA